MIGEGYEEGVMLMLPWFVKWVDGLLDELYDVPYPGFVVWGCGVSLPETGCKNAEEDDGCEEKAE